MYQKIKKIINSIENSQAPFYFFILTFFASCSIRTFFESYYGSRLMAVAFSHYLLSYIAVALGLIIIFHYASGETVAKVARLILSGFIVLCSVPVVDFVFKNLGYDIRVAYIFPQGHDLMRDFFLFFGPYEGMGITPGMRIEIFAVILGALLYFYEKTKKPLRSFLYALLVYVFLFAYCAMPFLTKFIFSDYDYTHPSVKHINFIFITIIFLSLLWIFYLHSNKLFLAILKDVRPYRLTHYLLMLFLGMVLATKSSIGIRPNPLFLPQALLLIIAITSAWIYSVITNNFADIEIDSISNRFRPLIAGKLKPTVYLRTSWIFLFVALFMAAAVGYIHLMLIIVYVSIYFIYSMPPLRLKRIPLFSKLLISINTLIIITLGHYFISGSMRIPTICLWIFLIGYTLALNFIDIKDYAGDKKEGIKTLPTILGSKLSQHVIGVFFFLAYTSVGLAIATGPLVILLVGIGVLQYFLITKKEYKEKGIMQTYLLSVLVLIIYLFYS